MSLRKVIKVLKENSRFLITSHINLEGDALGSEIAMLRLLEDEGKKAIILNEGDVPKDYSFLPRIKEIRKPKYNFSCLSAGRDFDVAIVLDCSDLNRCGRVKDLIKDKLILNIDHHTGNKRFGRINWLEPNSSSCCEMIYKIYKELNKPIKKDVALLLYTGILTDTGSFHFPNTTRFTHQAVADLLRFNLPLNSIYRSIYESIPFSDFKLIPKILLSLKKESLGKIYYLKMDKELLKRKRTKYDLTENILTLARSIRDAELVILFKEISPKETRVNLRSQGKFDVAKLARFFGGGGHRTAAGCTINKPLEIAQELVLEEARGMLKKNR